MTEVPPHRAPPVPAGGAVEQTDPIGETQAGDEPGSLQHAHGPRLVGVDDDGIVRLAAEQEADDAVVTGVRALQAALVAADREGGSGHSGPLGSFGPLL